MLSDARNLILMFKDLSNCILLDFYYKSGNVSFSRNLSIKCIINHCNVQEWTNK